MVLKIVVVIFALFGFGLTLVFVAQRLGLTRVPGAVDPRTRYFKEATIGGLDRQSGQALAWSTAPEWLTLKSALQKDQVLIRQVADETGVPARLIVSIIIGEQLRLYTSERELFKQVFAPLSILAVQSQFSLGITGIKEDTAKAIENHLRNASSTYYLGPDFEQKLSFKTDNTNQERVERLIDEHNHYYSYLYTALFLKQIMAEWTRAGFDISNRPEILATIFNLGFGVSEPKNNPQVGGAEITLNGVKYTFGAVAGDFVRSDELRTEFPY